MGYVLSQGRGLVLVRGGFACPAVSGGLSSGAALVDVRLDVVPLPPRSSSPTVAGCLLGGDHTGRDWWVESTLREGCLRTTTGVCQCWFSGHFRQVFFNTNTLPRINIGADVWGESSIMTGVYEHWCSSTLHIGWGLCDCLCLVLVSSLRYTHGLCCRIHCCIEVTESSNKQHHLERTGRCASACAGCHRPSWTTTRRTSRTATSAIRTGTAHGAS